MVYEELAGYYSLQVTADFNRGPHMKTVHPFALALTGLLAACAQSPVQQADTPAESAAKPVAV
jgi:hypothetical protein